MTIKSFSIVSALFAVACGGEAVEVTQTPMGEEGQIPAIETNPNTDADFFGCVQVKSNTNPLSQISSCTRPLIPPSGRHFCVKGTDYVTTPFPANNSNNNRVSILSIHGGLIEANTSAITLKASQLFNWNRYDFKAQGTNQCLRGDSNRAILHITATHFNDPDALNLVTIHPKATTIHGNRDLVGRRSNMVCVGGRDQPARAAFIAKMMTVQQQLRLNLVDGPTTDIFPCNESRGVDPDNIVNLTTSKKGLQLEMGAELLTALSAANNQNSTLVTNFYAALKLAMDTP